VTPPGCPVAEPAVRTVVYAATLTFVCLLVFAWQTEADIALLVAANRDERMDRPARSLCVLHDRDPRILGGRDELAGGTWLAVNEHGVVAGLTNRPSPGGRDPTKRTRGGLPILLAGHHSADAGVDELLSVVQPGAYNPAWLLVGDRHSLHFVEVPGDGPPTVRTLQPGVHVLENVPLDDPSPKADRIRSLVSVALAAETPLWSNLASVLVDHTIPQSEEQLSEEGDPPARPTATLAACVHTEDYGTRSAALVRVLPDPSALPEMLVADGPPCVTPFVDVSHRWST